MKKKKKDNLGTTRSLSTVFKIFLAVVIVSCPNFWHCFDESSSVEFDGSFSILSHNQKRRHSFETNAGFRTLRLRPQILISFSPWFREITVRVLRLWIRSWSRKFQQETLIRTDLTKSLAQSNNLRDESYGQSGLVCESYNLKHFKPPWSQCKQLRETVYKLRNVIYIYKFKVSLKTMESGSCQYGRVTMIFFIKASSNNRFAVFIGTAFQGKTRSKDTGSTIYLWRWINIAIVMFYLSCKGKSN